MKVAGYCRVSTDKEDQANSFASQKVYFRRYIQEHPDWELYEIYADEGITGTTTKKRTQFNRMIADAYEGKFGLILTKEVSRFSRNILDTIAYTRELKEIGIGVMFLTDRINTLEPETEMLLSYLASMAQEESRRTSSRVVWGQTRQMEKGVVFGQSLLGYDVKDGKLSDNPEGAEIVRLIFQKYALEQISTAQIARFLTAQGYQTLRGSEKWKPSAVIKILRNEKYAGDLVQKKTYTPDFLSHGKKTNKGAVPLVCIENHHEPIVSREVWNLARKRLEKNNKHCGLYQGHSNRYVFSGKIRCSLCGRCFVGRVKYNPDGSKLRRWACATVVSEGAAACGIGKLIRDDDGIWMLKTAIKELPMDRKFIVDGVTELAIEAILQEKTNLLDDPGRLQHEMDRVMRKKEKVMDSYFSGEIGKEDMQIMNRKYDDQLEKLKIRIQEAENCRQDKQDAQSLRAMLWEELTGLLSGEEESEVFFKTMLENMTVFQDRHVELRLYELPMVFHFSG